MLKLIYSKNRIYAKSGTFVICQEWDFCDMPKMEYSLERWRLFSENGDAITGQKLSKN